MKKGSIKDLCDVIAGQSPKGSAYNKDQKGIEFHQGKIAFGDLFIQPSGVWTTEITKLAEPNDILMSVRAPVGPTNLTNRQICIGRGLAAIRCKKGVMPRYILYALKRIEKQIVGNDGAVFNSINKKQIEELPVLIAPLPEQERIVSLLDTQFAKIDALKANADQQLKAAKDLFQSALKEMLTPKEGWEMKKVGDCFISINNGANIKQTKGAGGIPITRIETLSNGVFNVDRLGYANIDDTSRYSKYILKDGDLLMSHINSVEFVGRTVVYHDQLPIVIHGMNLLRLVPNTTAISDFYYYAFKAPWFRSQLEPIIHKSVNQASMNTTALKQVNIYIPNKEEQRKIVSRLDAISEKVKALQANYDQTITLCNDLKQSLLKSIFA